MGTPAIGADANLINVTVLPDQIKHDHYLLGRFNKETSQLNDVKVVIDRKVPEPTDLIRYQLIGSGKGLAVQAMPLDTLVKEKCEGWDGVSPINLFFSRESAAYVSWATTKTGTAAA